MKRNLFTKILALALCLAMIGSLGLTAFAATTSATIDTTLKGSFELYKIDFTNAEKDGVWDSSYVSTGVYDQNVNDKLINNAVRAGDDDTTSNLGNGQTSNGYAIKGVEFTYLKVADITTYSMAENGVAHVEVLYAIDAQKGAAMLSALGLDADDSYAPANPADGSKLYFQSDVLVNALREALVANATTVKNALEAYVKANGGTAMPLTNENGYTKADNLDLGLYLVVETKVPEMVTCTCNPFFLSLPMTSVDGTNVSAPEGGSEWLYDITLYPKNETGIPTLEKTVRESMDDTGKNDASDVITDGFAHTGTGSAGDVMEYQIISTLPSITSTASQLSDYHFTDTLSAGLSYVKDDVVIEFFTDAACTDKVATWTQADGKFDVSYSVPTSDPKASVMVIDINAAGLAEINTSNAVYTAASEVRRGYSDLTLRVTYSAKIDSDNTVVFGDSGNPNKVVLTWKRSSSEYYDTLIDDAHVYTYGIDLTKVFAGKNNNPAVDGDFSKVEFVVWNNTDGYWVKAELNEVEGIYYVVDHLVEGGESGHEDGAAHADLTAQEAAEAALATKFVPVTAGTAVTNPTQGKVIIKGLEDDEYIITEIRTSNGYTLLKDHITVEIGTVETTELCEIYDEDILGLIQNDPRYATIVNGNVDTVLGLKNMPQKHLEHHLLTASATVDGNDVTMLADNGSVNAEAPLTVVNTHGFDLPQTGEYTTIIATVGGTLLVMVGCFCFFLLVVKRREDEEQA